jgi:hypothetical protein
MNKKELAANQCVSIARIGQIMKELKFEKEKDYNWKVNIRNNNEIMFTSAGVRKIQNRNKKTGRRKKLEL